MKYSIIIPSYIRPIELRECINNLIDILNENLKLVIVLDGSPKPIFDMVRAFKSKHVHILEGDGNLFWGGAINAGMEFAFNNLASERVIWLNDDTVFTSEDVQKFISEPYDSNTIVGARLIGRNVNRNIYKVEEGKGLVHVDYLNGNFTSIPVSAFKFFGNIDSNKFPHFADAPYLERIAKNKNYSLLVNSSVTVDIHYDVLRHLSMYEQFILRKDRFNFFYWSLFDIRSKWYLPYRKNYYLNKFGTFGYFIIVLGFLRDWTQVICVTPFVSFIKNKAKKSVLNKLKTSLTDKEYHSLLEELK